MYKSKRRILNEPKAALLKKIEDHINQSHQAYCRFAKRNCKLERFAESNKMRKNGRQRLSSFFVALDILKHQTESQKIVDEKGYTCFNIRGYDKNGILIEVHIREEIIQKDRILFLVSSFPKKAPTP